MRLPRPSAAVLCATLAAHASFAADGSGSPNTVLFNGKIFTANASHPYVQALAIRGDRIVATGESATMRALSGPQTRSIDLGGHTVIPGINDAHQHLSVTPPGLVALPLKSEDPTWSEVREAIRAAARNPGRPIVATIGSTVLEDDDARRNALDQLAPGRPVILRTPSTYAFILNSAALKQFGIRDDEPDPLGGSYDRLPDGGLNGVARGYAAMAILRKEASLTPTDEAVGQLRETLHENARFGITTLQDMADEISAERVLDLLTRVPTPIRVRIIRMPLTTPGGRDLREGRSLPLSPAPLIRVSGTKWKLDGNPFDGPHEKRLVPGDPPLWALSLTFRLQELESMLRQSLSLEYNDQLVLHVSGTPAARAMLEAMEDTGGPQVWRNRRVRFEHGDGILPSFLPRLQALGVIVVQNPAHLNLGELRTLSQQDSSQPLRSLLAAGIPVALGSDGPLNPYLNIALACTHPDRPSEALTREQAVTAYTLTSAYSEFMEQEKGSLEGGKLADLAVLSQDIFTAPPEQLPKTASVLTMVGGAIVYNAHLLPAH